MQGKREHKGNEKALGIKQGKAQREKAYIYVWVNGQIVCGSVVCSMCRYINRYLYKYKKEKTKDKENQRAKAKATPIP